MLCNVSYATTSATTGPAGPSTTTGRSPEPYRVVDQMFDVIRVNEATQPVSMASSSILASARERRQSSGSGQSAAGYAVSIGRMQFYFCSGTGQR